MDVHRHSRSKMAIHMAIYGQKKNQLREQVVRLLELPGSPKPEALMPWHSLMILEQLALQDARAALHALPAGDTKGRTAVRKALAAKPAPVSTTDTGDADEQVIEAIRHVGGEGPEHVDPDGLVTEAPGNWYVTSEEAEIEKTPAQQ